MATATPSTDHSRWRAVTAPGPGRRILLATGVIVALLAGTAGVSAWRYERALSATHSALLARMERSRSVIAQLGFWREREAMNEYLLIHDPAILTEVRDQTASLEAALDGLGIDEPAEQALVRDAEAGNRLFLAEFERIRAEGRHDARGRADATTRLNSREEPVTSALDGLRDIYQAEIPVRLAVASHAQRQAGTRPRDAGGASPVR